MNTIENLTHSIEKIESRLQYTFKDPALLILAFTHRSYINEHRSVSQHNERLEFLGDSVLGLLTAEYLYRELPTTPEGDLSYLRSRLVEASSCVSFVQKLELEKYLLLGRGERMNDGRGRESILADLFEAIIGAIYLDGGIEAARHFLFDNFTPNIEETVKSPLANWKALLQDYCQKIYQTTPVYKVIEEVGPDHSKNFVIAVMIFNEEKGRGLGASKKEAQQSAAADALSRIQKES
ncbi:MAG: ribonuclease III [Parachlamydiaceae bacterium]